MISKSNFKAISSFYVWWIIFVLCAHNYGRIKADNSKKTFGGVKIIRGHYRWFGPCYIAVNKFKVYF